jgi:hypothetical protein
MTRDAFPFGLRKCRICFWIKEDRFQPDGGNKCRLIQEPFPGLEYLITVYFRHGFSAFNRNNGED